MPNNSELDLGYIVTGVIQKHPTDNTWVLLVKGPDGNPGYFAIEDILNKYKGQEVRLTVATMETIARLTAMVEGEKSTSS